MLDGWEANEGAGEKYLLSLREEPLQCLSFGAEASAMLAVKPLIRYMRNRLLALGNVSRSRTGRNLLVIDYSNTH